MPDTFLDPNHDDQQLLAQVIAYYHATLTNSTEAQDYLRKRGITNSQAIERFRIGHADRTLGFKLPANWTKAGRVVRDRLQQLGLYRATAREHFNGCVTFPIFAADGSQQIVDVYGRKIGSGLRRGTPLHMHLNDHRRGVWNVEAFTASKEIVLLPSLFDALTFWSHGYRNVTCMFGPDAITADHLAAFKEFKTERILTPCQAVTAKLMAAGLDVFLLKLPNGLDANAYALQVSDPADALGAALRRAEWLGKGEAVSVPQSVPSVIHIEPQAMLSEFDDDDDELAELGDDGEDDDKLEQPESLPTVTPATETAEADTPQRSASPLPPAPVDVDADINDNTDEVSMTLGNRRYRIRGLSKNLSYDVMKVNVLASNDSGMFVDTFDLYAAKYRRSFVVQASQELNVDEATIKKDLGRVLLKLEELQDRSIESMLTPKETMPTMTEQEKAAAMQLLHDPQFMDRIVADLDVVGERTNKLAGYLAAISRKLDQPLAVIIQSTSAAGKTALMEAVLAFVPPEDQVKFSAMTGQSLFYMGDMGLKHKILAIVEEEGAERASYALKLLQSEGELRIASTGKEASTGRLTTQEYRVEGPVMIFLTTTAIKVDEELLNRCIVLTVDEDREQTKAIHQAQRKRQTIEALINGQQREQTLALHRNAQRLLKPLLVANPYAEQLTFLDDKTRTRRDHVKYLTLIRAITLLHQHQRPSKTIEHQGKTIEYIEVTPDDIDAANKIAGEVLSRGLDEMPPQTRRLLNMLDGMVTDACQRQGVDRADYRFSRREVLSYTGWSLTQLRLHLDRLVELECLLVHRGCRGRSFVYELLYEAPANNDGGLLARLIDVAKLRRTFTYDGKPGGVNGQLAGS